MIYDLHSHSSASDGALDPPTLLAHAAECGVDALAITDHDTLRAYEQLERGTTAIHLIVGVELSTTWRGIGVHVVGLNVDPASQSLRDGVERQRRSRLDRARTIAARLQAHGVTDCLPAVQRIADSDYIGRPHFAKYLVDAGFARDTRDAFRKYLGAGKTGDVKHGWAPMEDTVAWIRSAGGTAVLAHPAKYGLTKTRLRSMARDFKDAGGEAIEVVCGPQSAKTTSHLARLANALDLSASCGSDFHSPEFSWSRPGGFPELPGDVRPVWDLW